MPPGDDADTLDYFLHILDRPRLPVKDATQDAHPVIWFLIGTGIACADAILATVWLLVARHT